MFCAFNDSNLSSLGIFNIWFSKQFIKKDAFDSQGSEISL